jgi:hypothetical protein
MLNAKLLGDTEAGRSKAGDIVAIVGFCRGADDRPYAVVRNGKLLDMVGILNLEIVESPNSSLSECCGAEIVFGIDGSSGFTPNSKQAIRKCSRCGRHLHYHPGP